MNTVKTNKDFKELRGELYEEVPVNKDVKFVGYDDEGLAEFSGVCLGYSSAPLNEYNSDRVLATREELEDLRNFRI